MTPEGKEYHEQLKLVKRWERESNGQIMDVKSLMEFKGYESLDDAIENCMVFDRRDNTLTLLFTYPYEIDLDRVKTPIHLIDWLNHLLTKGWFYRELVTPFLVKVCKIKRWKIHDA